MQKGTQPLPAGTELVAEVDEMDIAEAVFHPEDGQRDLDGIKPITRSFISTEFIIISEDNAQ